MSLMRFSVKHERSLDEARQVLQQTVDRMYGFLMAYGKKMQQQQQQQRQGVGSVDDLR